MSFGLGSVYQGCVEMKWRALGGPARAHGTREG